MAPGRPSGKPAARERSRSPLSSSSPLLASVLLAERIDPHVYPSRPHQLLGDISHRAPLWELTEYDLDRGWNHTIKHRIHP